MQAQTKTGRNTMSQARKVENTAYGRSKPKPEALLTEVGPGTPCGEMLRRYWQPVAASNKVTSRPGNVRILCEDLILFRDGSGRAGMLYPHCAHRGTSLFWGHVESDGIRCCYHGWKFDVEGRCLDQPCEPQGGINKAAIRQPWYPVEERYGLIWAYMGPPEKMPLLPRFEHLEPLAEGEFYYVLDNSILSHADLDGPPIVPYSWLNINENTMDPFHVYILHANFGSTHFMPDFAIMPQVTWGEIDVGTIYTACRLLPDGREMKRVLTWVAPNMAVIPGADAGRCDALAIFTAVDDCHSRTFVTKRAPAGFTDKNVLEGKGFATAKPWTRMTVEERQDAPNDYEAQSSQGLHGLPNSSDEHLVRSDTGIGMQRRVLRREIEKVSAGRTPINLAFRPGDEVIHTPSGNFFTDAQIKA
jgi:nitrite reductase/ring-hydroxylating ferredoxin subunit